MNEKKLYDAPKANVILFDQNDIAYTDAISVPIDTGGETIDGGDFG